MVSFLTKLIKNYFTSYVGLSFLCWQGILLNGIESTLIGIYYFLPLYFVKNLHLSVMLAGMLISFYGMGTIMGGFLGGKLSDKFTPGLISIYSLFLQAINFFILTHLTLPFLLMINLFSMGIASYSFITSNSLWVLSQCQSDENKRLQAITLLNAASNLGLSISAIIIGLLNYKFKFIFSFSVVLLILLGVYSILIDKFSTENSFSTLSETKEVLSDNYKRKLIWVLFTCLFLVGLIIFQTNTTYSFYIQDTFKVLGLKSLSILFTLNCLLVVFIQTPIANLFRNINKILIAGIGAFLLGFGMFMLIFSSSFILAIIATIVYTVGEILFFSVAQLICYQSVPLNKKGQMMGMYRMIYACSRVVAPAAGGFIYQQLGGRVLWIICGCIGLFCLGVCNYCKKYVASV